MIPASLPYVHALFDSDDPAPVAIQAEGFRFVMVSRRSPVKESANEDSGSVVQLDGQSAVLTVADGVGGARAGDVASKLVIEHLSERLLQTTNEDSVRERTLSAIESANAAILALGVGAASTVTCVTIQDRQLRSFQVGDSIALVVGQRGKIKHQTVSHSPVGYLVESGMIGEEQAMEHSERHLVSNLVGSNDMSVEMGNPLPLAARDTVLVASDGLTDNLLPEEIAEIIRKGDLEKAAIHLEEQARSRMLDPSGATPSKPDDLTFVLARLA